MGRVSILNLHGLEGAIVLWQDAEKVRQPRSRVAHRLNVRNEVRFASSLAAALLDGHFEHPAWLFGMALTLRDLRRQ